MNPELQRALDQYKEGMEQLRAQLNAAIAEQERAVASASKLHSLVSQLTAPKPHVCTLCQHWTDSDIHQQYCVEKVVSIDFSKVSR